MSVNRVLVVDRETVGERTDEKVMKTAGGGYWMPGVSKGTTQPTGISLPSTILLGALEGNRQLKLKAKGRTGLQMYMYIKRIDSPTITDLTVADIDRVGLSVLPSPMSP